MMHEQCATIIIERLRKQRPLAVAQPFARARELGIEPLPACGAAAQMFNHKTQFIDGRLAWEIEAADELAPNGAIRQPCDSSITVPALHINVP
jgi:hypothetical protein